MLVNGMEVTQADGTPGHDKVNYAGHMAAINTSGEDFAAQKLVPHAGRTRKSVFNKEMVARMCVGKYRTQWDGQVLMKDAVSVSLYMALIQRLKPGTIFDLGTCGGGSALWFAALVKSMGLDTKIVTFDIQDTRSEKCKQRMKELGNVEFIIGDLYDGANVLKRAMASGQTMAHPWLVSEDCHVDAEVILRAFKGAGMQVGDYILFEDTHPLGPNDSYMDAESSWGIKYEVGKFPVEKLDLVDKAMTALGDEFAMDAGIQDLYGYNGALFVNSVYVKQK